MIINVVFRKAMENIIEILRDIKNRDIKLITKERRRNCFVSEPNYQTTKFFIENLLEIKMKKQRYL